MAEIICIIPRSSVDNNVTDEKIGLQVLMADDGNDWIRVVITDCHYAGIGIVRLWLTRLEASNQIFIPY